MIELDMDNLSKVNEWAKGRIVEYDRRRQNAPSREAMVKAMGLGIAELTTVLFPKLMAGSQAKTRKSIASLEKINDALSDVESSTETALLNARLRTAALRRWLEDIS
jgi:hypothetical protein